MRELWILFVSVVGTYFWVPEFYYGNVLGAAVIVVVEFIVAIGGLFAWRYFHAGNQ